MRLEIEAKIKVDNFDPITQRLSQIGAAAVTIVWEEDLYFDADDRSLAKKDCGLRLRKRIIKAKGEQFILAFKGPRQNSAFKSRPEIETVVANHEAMLDILDQLGYHKCLRVEKKRMIWRVEPCEVCLDEVAMLGRFVEIEGPDEATVAMVLDKLGLAQEKHIHEGYVQMIAKQLSGGK